MRARSDAGHSAGGFEHEAFLYAGPFDFLQGTLPFIQAGLEADEPVLVVVEGDKVEQLRTVLGADARRVAFGDMAEVGHNPARIIPAWRDFLDQHGGGLRPVRGIGEPIWADRSPDELVECQRHEALLNVAFAGRASMRLLCPYDITALAPDVLAEAARSHPYLAGASGRRESADYRGDTSVGANDDLPEPPGETPMLAFDSGPLEPVRQFVTDHVRRALGPDELSDLLLAVTEVASNSLVHGGGQGALRVWSSADGVVCEIRDRGWIQAPLIGRSKPSVEPDSGRGLWMVNQLCDLVQLRSSPAGTVIRLHMHRRPQAAQRSG